MPVTIEINGMRIAEKIDQKWKRNLFALSGEILKDCNDYVKKDTTALEASSYIHSKLDEGLIIWQTKYAERQYWEIKTAFTDVNPNATWKWAHVAKDKNLKKWIKQAQMLMRGGI